MKISKLFSAVVAAASTLFVALSARAEFTCELSFPQAPLTALANFPVLVRLAEDAPTGFSYADCPTASCIWFTDENGDAIPCDVDTWDTAGESLVWVSVPSLSSSATITMHWDAAGAPAGLPAASQVWSRAGYNAVWHFNGSNVESVTNLVPTTTRGKPTYNGNLAAPGPVGKTLWLDGSSDLRYDPDPAWTTLGDGSALSVSFWARVTRGPSFTRMVSCMSAYDKPAGYEITLQNSYTSITVGSSGKSQFQTDITTGPNTAWKYFVGTYSGTTVKFYDDGVKKGEGTKNAVVAPTEALTLGGTGGEATTNPLTGGLDEIRIRRVASSDDWVAAEYATATDANYVSFGEVGTGVEVLRLGAVAVSEVTATNAVVTGELRMLGEGATSANVWLVYTDGATTRSVSLGTKGTEPSALSVTLENLTEKTAYTCWFTATNNLSAGSDSPTATFKTKRIPTGSGIYECELSFPFAPATPLANFPVLVRLSEAAIEGFYYEHCPIAANLWFTDANGDALPFEVDTWNASGESLVWVSVPSLSSATTIKIHWAANVGSVEDSPDAHEVWTRADYVGVWHMNEILEDGTGKHYTPDSSASGWHAYKANESDAYPVTISDAGMATTVPPTGHAMVNQLGDNNRKTGGFIVPPSATSGTTIGPFTVSLFEENSSGNNDRAFAIGGTRGNQWENGCLTANKNTTYVMSPNSGHGSFTYGDSLADNAWRHIAGVFNTTLAGYVGGVYKDPNKSNVNPVTTLNYGLGLGTFVNHTETFTGYLDEIRIRNAASTAEWIAEEYKTVTTANYVSFGDVEEVAAVMSFEFGTPYVLSISATGATISARLKGLGDGATSANMWLVVTGFGQTRTYPLYPATEPKVVVAALTGLQPGVSWTAYITATNNAAPAVGADSAPAAFTTSSDAGAGSPGLYQAVTHSQANVPDAAANWDIAASGVVTLGPLAMRSSGNNHDYWASVDGTSFTWENNIGFGYAGYMYMEGGKDYYFGASADDAGYVWVDNGDANWNAKRTGSQFGGYGKWNKAGPYAISESGYYRVVFANWNNNGGAGAEPTASVLFPKMRYIALESGASAPTAGDAGWQEAVDSGDGSLFITEAPTRAVSVLSAVRDGTLLSARVAVGEAFPGEASDLRYVYGATNGGSDPADWEGGALVASSLPTTAATNDYLVGIASDTRFVRFYTQDGDAITWSATVSLDWAGETTIAGGFLFLGDPDASAVSGDTVTLSAVLNAPGEDATEAQVWFVVSGGGVTRTIPAAAATAMTNLSVAVTGLAPETTYTFYATATNNAATSVGVDSAVATFTTGAGASAWNTSRATFTPDGKSLTATVPVTSLGVGTTTLYLMTGNNWNSENTVSASQVVTATGEQTLAATFPDSPWGTKVYYSLMMVNGTAESTVTNWPNVNVAGSNVFHDKSIELQDNSTYTWVGGSAGVWNVPANWSLTTPGSYAATKPAGYPVFGSTAIFATAEGADPITVTIPGAQGTTRYSNENRWWVLNLNLDGMHEELVFTSEDIAAANCRFTAWNLIGNQTYNRLTFDGCNVYIDNVSNFGATAADANGENAVIALTDGTKAQFNGFKVNRPGVKVVADGATFAMGDLTGGTAAPPPVLEIGNATVSSRKLEPDTNNSLNGTTIRLTGTNATLTAQWFQVKYTTSTNLIDFVIPVGGYNAVPIQLTHATLAFPNNSNTAQMTLRVPKDSPGLKSIGSRGIQLLYSKGGINAANVRFEDVKASKNGFFFKDADGNEYADAAAIEAAGKTSADITQIWYRGPARPLTIVVR